MIIKAEITKNYTGIDINLITFSPDGKNIKIVGRIGNEKKVKVILGESLKTTLQTSLLNALWDITKGAFPEITETENPYNFEPEIYDLGTIEE